MPLNYAFEVLSQSMNFAFMIFFERSPGDELSPPEFTFHRCRTSREVEGRGAKPDTISPEKYNGGGRNYNSNKQQHHQQHLTETTRRTNTRTQA
jgi:hypothetical protein